MKKRAWTLALAIPALLGILTGCVKSSQANTQSPGASSASASSAAAPVTISALHMYITEDTSAGAVKAKEVLKEVKSKYPNVTLEEEVIPPDTYEVKMKTYAAGNQLPDIFMVKGTMVPILAKENQIIPVTEMIDGHPDWKPSIKSGVLEAYSYGGKAYGVTSELRFNGLIFYNSDLFAKAGAAEFPASWEDFLALIPKLADLGVTPVASGNRAKAAVPSNVFNTIAYRFVDAQWTDDIVKYSGKAKFTDPAFLRAVAALQQLADAKAFNSDINSIEKDQMRSMYYNKKAAMYFDGDWAISSLLKNAPEDVINATRFACVPKMKDGLPNSEKRVAGGPSWGWVVSSKVTGERKKEIIGSILYDMTGPTAARALIENSCVPSCVPKSFDESKISKLYQLYIKTSKEWTMAPVFDMVFPPAVVDTYYTGMQEVVINTLKPENFAAQLQKSLDSAN